MNSPKTLSKSNPTCLDGDRRFSLDPQRDVSNLPFTPDDIGMADRRSQQQNRSSTRSRLDELDGESWSTSDSAPSSRWSSSKRMQEEKDNADFAHPDDPSLNTESLDTLNEIRSGLIEVMDSGSLESGSSSATPPLATSRDHGLRVETRPPPQTCRLECF
jgi:hypothetical protein